MSKTNPISVEEANQNLFRAKWNIPTAAEHCGMTQKQMKLTFREFLKYHPKDYNTMIQLPLSFKQP